MKWLLQEMRQRGVLRVAGLYIAFLWLTLQVGDVVLPAFELPDSALRYALFVGLGGLPVVMLLSWFYEITPEGIVTEEEAREHGGQRQGNQTITLVTIFVLVMALGVSLYVNFQQASEEPVEQDRRVVTLLVADFLNETGDPLFDGSLEAALSIGLEGASFVSAYPRNRATQVAAQINPNGKLEEQTARLVSMREGIDLVLSGSITTAGGAYTLTQRLLDPLQGELIAEAKASADSKLEVLPAVGDLAAQIREALGDVSLEDGSLATSETFTSTSLEAVKFFTEGQDHAFREENLKAIDFFEKAVQEDPNFGRAYAAWALSEMKLGRREKSESLWEEALSHIDSMTERERYRTLGLYYTTVADNQSKAIENYELLVQKYPADGIGRNNLGVAYFYTLQFDKAMEVGGELVELFSGNPAFRANYALFAMYAGNFELARSEAEKLLAEKPGYFLAYLPVAIAQLADGDVAQARATYQTMSEQGERANSLANTGLADVALLQGDFAAAEQLLSEGRTADLAFGNSLGHDYKGIYLAKSLAGQGSREAALALLDESTENGSSISHLVPAALLYVDLGQPDRAAAIVKKLKSSLQANQRAAADAIGGAIALAEGDLATAVDAFNASLQRRDFWLTRFHRGRAYALAGNHAEALGDFEMCLERLGESAAIFLDDVPTFHYHAPLYYWLGRTQQAMKSLKGAREHLARYVSLRLDTDTTPVTQDARDRLAALPET